MRLPSGEIAAPELVPGNLIMRLRAPLSKSIEIDIGVAALVARVSQTSAVSGEDRTHADDAIVRELVGSCSVVIASINLFVSGSIGHKGHLESAIPF